MKRIIASIAIGFLFVWGCSPTGPNNTNGTGELKMYLVDSPTNLDSVIVSVSKVEVQQAGSDSTHGWVTLNNTLRYFDLLQLRNGANAILGDTSLSTGLYTQIRLVLGNTNYVVDSNGVNIPLIVPSSLQTGIKLYHQFKIEAYTLYELMLDFNVERSIIVTGNLNYQLNPAIRVIAKITSGTISGTINPATATSLVWTMDGTDKVSTMTNDQGFFKLMALPQGSYNVTITPQDNSFSETTISGVKVIAGQNTSLGTTIIH